MSSLEEQTAQQWEAQWWGSCTATFGEEAKQITYAHRMGLVNEPQHGKWPVYDLRGASVVDLGGGPVSMLLKCVNGWGVVVDPCPYPTWVEDRYAEAHLFPIDEYVPAEIFYDRKPAEDWNWVDGQGRKQMLSEAWIYNVLQHVVDPEKVIATARRNAHRIRIFEWIEMETNLGHPHSLHADDLNRWLGGVNGTVSYVDENGATGLAYYGAFP